MSNRNDRSWYCKNRKIYRQKQGVHVNLFSKSEFLVCVSWCSDVALCKVDVYLREFTHIQVALIL